MYLKLEEETASNITNNDTKYHEYTYRQSVSWGKKKKNYTFVCMKFWKQISWCVYDIQLSNLPSAVVIIEFSIKKKLHIKKKFWNSEKRMCKTNMKHSDTYIMNK